MLWSSTARQKFPDNLDDLPVPSALVVIQSLHVANVLVQSFDEKDIAEITSDKSQGNFLVELIRTNAHSMYVIKIIVLC